MKRIMKVMTSKRTSIFLLVFISFFLKACTLSNPVDISTMPAISEATVPDKQETMSAIQNGFWITNKDWGEQENLASVHNEIVEKTKTHSLTPMLPEILEFKDWVTSDNKYFELVNSMINESNQYAGSIDKSTKQEWQRNGGSEPWIDDYDSFFQTLNEIITTTPSFSEAIMVSCPLNAFLAIAMGTKSGLILFHDETFNQQIKKVLDTWNAYLDSEASLDKLDIDNPEKEGSWISKAAWKAGVWDQIEHNKNLPGYGYNSWNSFFTRRFIPDARPFQGEPDNDINIGCETTPWLYKNNLEMESQFSIKATNYSLLDLFGGQAHWAKIFEGGQLYQGYLSGEHYHRWHAPVDGKLVSSWLQPGTYYAQSPAQLQGIDTWFGLETQPYLGHVATRAIFIFKHEIFGYIGLINVGMMEVSTCHIEPNMLVKDGDQSIDVKRGTEIGHFEYGGSSHILVFQKGKVQLKDWALNPQKNLQDDQLIKLGSVIGSALKNNTGK
ncbi:phosphatidylserine decarboxylase family protein [uncultured Endozoicomonas sp.]|uniref:phosphatidylserine decarboxylase family protein n=1 Tax=uncultured Endozoicomonas sp. TaxID=432652 RepID=UPI00262D8E04|nr:phosphatidylserine decarboxylase family protein [uncultured Endozoicomonas sp.]